jgi:Fe2+ transport system protein B
VHDAASNTFTLTDPAVHCKDVLRFGATNLGTSGFEHFFKTILMMFYLLAMQCMSTLAVVKRETKSWKYPIIQLFYMTGLAYVLSFAVYNIFK